MNDQDRDKLSAEGHRRKETMLDDLLGQIDRRRAARRIQRRATWVVGIVVVGALVTRVAWQADSGPGLSRDRIVQLPTVESPDNSESRVTVVTDTHKRRQSVRIVSTLRPTDVAFIKSDPLIIERLSVAAARSFVRRVDDRGLMDSLAAIDRPAGLIRIAGKTRLSRPVSDAELALHIPTGERTQ